MTETRIDPPQANSPHPYDLELQLERMRSEIPFRTNGRDSFTLVREPGFTLLLVVLNTGALLPEHKAPGPISVLVLEGRVAFSAQAKRLELGLHGLVTLPAQMLHKVEALEDSAILVTIVLPVKPSNTKLP